MNTNWPEEPCPFTRPVFSYREWWPADPAHRPPWQPLEPLHVHVAKTWTVACGADLLRAADPTPKRSR
jgi:hypothetical protein